MEDLIGKHVIVHTAALVFLVVGPVASVEPPRPPSVEEDHDGAFRLEYSVDWLSTMERSKGRTPFEFDRYDAYQWFLELGPLPNVDAKYLHGAAPGWTAFADHPDLDDYWISESCSVLPHISGAVTVPTLNVAGWFDAEDFYGPMKVYAKYDQGDVDETSTISRRSTVVGKAAPQASQDQ